MITYSYFKESNVIETSTSGELCSNDIITHYEKILRNDAIQSGFVEIVDLNSLNDFILKYSELEKLVAVSEKLLLKGHKITLFCTFNSVSSEIASMMTPIFHRVKANIHMCYSETEFIQSKKIFLTRSST